MRHQFADDFVTASLHTPWMHQTFTWLLCVQFQ